MDANHVYTADAEMTVLAFAPHLDDAVLSVGASLAAAVERGLRVVVCTVFAGDPEPPLTDAARAFHAHCDLEDDAVAIRRTEDLAALAEIGAAAIHLTFADAIYRRYCGIPLYRRPDAAFDPNWPLEPLLTRDLVAELSRVVAAARPSQVWTCLGAGNHVDHRLVRQTTTRLALTKRLPVLLWEDLPYAIGTPAGPARLVRPVQVAGHHLRAKITAASHYRSQHRALWPAHVDWSDQLLDHARLRAESLGMAEPLWAPTADVRNEPPPPTSERSGRLR